MAWYDGKTFMEIQRAIQDGSAPGARRDGAFIRVPRGYLRWLGFSPLLTIGGIIEDQQEIESAARQAGPEDPLQSCDCQTLPVEGSIGGPGPLADANPDKAPEVQGVDSHAEDDLASAIAFCLDESFGDGPTIPVNAQRSMYGALAGFLGRSIRPSPPLGGLTGTQAAAAAEMMNRPLHPGIAAWGSLDKLVADAIAGGATTGTLAVTSGDFRASASWRDGVVESAFMSKKAPDCES